MRNKVVKITEQINKIKFPLISLAGLVPLKLRWPSFTAWDFHIFKIHTHTHFFLQQVILTPPPRLHETDEWHSTVTAAVPRISACVKGEVPKFCTFKDQIMTQSYTSARLHQLIRSGCVWFKPIVDCFHKGFLILERDLRVRKDESGLRLQITRHQMNL